jgi:hypothetical protein
MTKVDNSTTLHSINRSRRHQLCEIAEEWREEMNLLGPFGDDTAVEEILSRVPDCCEQDANVIQGWVDGRRGTRDSSRASDPNYLNGFWLAIGRRHIETFGPEQKAVPSAAALATLNPHQ